VSSIDLSVTSDAMAPFEPLSSDHRLAACGIHPIIPPSALRGLLDGIAAFVSGSHQTGCGLFRYTAADFRRLEIL
jgi:hypothetical protein